MSDGVAERAYFKAIGERTESWGVAGFPGLTETNYADAKFHGEDAGCGIRGRDSWTQLVFRRTSCLLRTELPGIRTGSILALALGN